MASAVEATRVISDTKLTMFEEARVAFVTIGKDHNSARTVIENMVSTHFGRVDGPSDSPAQWDNIRAAISGAHIIILLFNKPPSVRDMPARILKLTMEQCAQSRSRIGHVIKNYSSENSELLKHRRVRRMLHYMDWAGGSNRDTLKLNLESGPQNVAEFSSIGESFAWQVLIGFLSNFLPQFESEIDRQLQLDEHGEIPVERLRSWGIVDANPDEVIVVKKYFMLLTERLLHEKMPDNQDPRYPDPLYPDCRKIFAGSESEIVFKCPGYDRMLPMYKVKLRPDQSGPNQTSPYRSRFKWAILFCGFAAPTSIIGKLEDTSFDKKVQIFSDMRDELKYVLNHPRSSQLLCQLSSNISTDHVPTGYESGAVKLLELDEIPIETQLSAEINDYLAKTDMPALPEGLPVQQGEHGTLLLRFGASFDSNTKKLVEKFLADQGFEIDRNWESILRTDCYKRVLFVLSLEELQQISRDDELGRDVKIAADGMHLSGEYNVSMVIAQPNQSDPPSDIFTHLPDCLQDLPRSCVKVTLPQNAVVPTGVPSAANHSPEVQSLMSAINKLELLQQCMDAEATFPLMSLAPAMAANITVGLCSNISQYVQRTRGTAQEIGFDPPYIFVNPKSGHCPDETTLYECMQKIEATVERKALTEGGRKINYRVFSWCSRRIAFEFLSPLRFIHKLADCELGGLTKAELVAENLKELRVLLNRDFRGVDGGGRSRACSLVDWDDDVTGFPEYSLRTPGERLAYSLVKCLEAELEG